MTVLYRAGVQLLKVRAMMWLSFATAVGFGWWGWDLFQTLGLRPADGGVLQPLLVRLLVGGLLAALGLAFLFGMWVYSRLYVAAIAYDPDDGRLLIHTPGFIGTRTERFAPSELKGSGYRKGRLANPVGVSVDAPWYGLKAKGRRFSYIIDAQGQWLDPEVARQVLSA